MNQQTIQQLLYRAEQHLHHPTIEALSHKAIPELFKETARRKGASIALQQAERTLTYAELDRLSDRVAYTLITQGMTDQVVGVCLPRGIEVVIAVYGILKAGAIYLPLDPGNPAARMQFIAHDAQMAGLITQGSLLAALPELPTWDIEQLTNTVWEKTPTLPTLSPTHYAYVMFTSGSTGQPKGVAIRHNQLAMLAWSFRTNHFGYREEDVFLSFASLNFGGSIVEIFTVTLLGAKLVIAQDKEKKDPEELMRLLELARITYAIIPPAFLAYCPCRTLPDLRAIIISGEATACKTLPQWQAQKQIVNSYGFTENTVIVTSGVLEPGRAYNDTGFPVEGVSCYLLDEQRQLTPDGEIGELYVGGYLLTDGYLNHPELNETKFIDNPFVSAEDKAKGVNTRLFQTGDLMRWTPDRRLIFIGRADFQIKINGIRIETGEIETVLKRHPSVQQAIVVAHEHLNRKHLVAYVQSDVPETISLPMLYQLLHEQLPDYMIPTTIIPLSHFPTNLNGKVDRHQLPPPVWETTEADTHATKNEKERRLFELWQALLGPKQFQADSHFLQEGGDSIALLQLTMQLNEQFGLSLQAADLYAHPSFGEQLSLIEQVKDSTPSVILPHADRTQPLPLSPTQHSLWLQCALSQEAQDAYNQPYLISLGQTIDPSRWEAAWNRLVAQQESLRTSFRLDRKGNPCLQIHPYVPQAVSLIRLPKDDLWKTINTEANHSFQLYEEPLCRMQLYQEIESGDYYAFILIHHLLVDGWSCEQILDKQLRQLYANPESVPTPAYQYADYAQWKQSLSQPTNDFWSKYLADNQGLLLPNKKGRVLHAAHYEGATHYLPLPPSLKAKMSQLCQQATCTPFTLGLATYMLLLRKYSGQANFTVGFPFADREQAAFQEVIGYFVYMLPMLFKADYEKLSFTHYLKTIEQVKQELTQQVQPLDRLIQAIQSQQPQAAPVMQTSFSVENASLYNRWIQRTTSTFPLAFTLLRDSQGDQLLIEYMTDLFEADWIELLGEAYLILLEEVCAHPEHTLSQLQPYTDDYILTVIQANTLPIQPEEEKTVLDLWRNAVTQYAHLPAYSYQGKSYTYQTVDAESDRIAQALLKRLNKGLNRRIGLCLREKRWAPAAIWGILKAGCSYLPIDPTLPEERKQFMLADGEIALLLGDAGEHIGDQSCIPVSFLAEQSLTVPPVVETILPDDLAYIIYTSGTTGQPKGTPITHRNLMHFVCTMQRTYQLDPQSRVLQFANLSFDASVEEFFIPLTHGAQLVLPTEEERKDPIRLFELLQQEAVTCLPIAPAMLTMLPRQALPALRQIIVGGEQTAPSTLAYWSARYTLYNTYGPTENTVDSTCIRMTPESPANDIGCLIEGVSGYLLDEQGQLVPEGAIGELCLGGAQLTMGYLHRPTLNAEKFIPNPYQSESDRQQGRNGRLYRSGDLVLRRRDGHLIFFGRKDAQVKLRGFRIELSEIEQCLQACPEVRHVWVLPFQQGETKQLAAYVQPKPIATLDFKQLRDHLKAYLPTYMIPTYWALIDRLPMTHSGKLNPATLPQPTRIEQELPAEARPTTMEEEQLSYLAALQLGMEQVSIHADLFDLGLTSIQAMSLVMDAARKGIELSVAALYRQRTIHETLRHRPQDPNCYWYNQPDDKKPVLLVVSGYAPFYMVYREFAAVMSQSFSLLVLESYHNLLFHQADCSFDHVMDLYMETLRPILKQHPIAAFTGLCLGGELALQLANRCSDEGINPLPKVFVIDGFTDTSEAGTVEAYPLALQSPELTTEMTRITNALSLSFRFRPYPGEVHLLRAAQFSKQLEGPDKPEEQDPERLAVPYARFAGNVASWKTKQPGCRIYEIEATHWTILFKEPAERMREILIKAIEDGGTDSTRH